MHTLVVGVAAAELLVQAGVCLLLVRVCMGAC
jgi:hypothetical protein